MQRILTAILLGAFIVCLLLWGGAYLLAAVEVAIAELALWEFFRLAEDCGALQANPVARLLGYTFGGAIVALSLVEPFSRSLLAAATVFLLLLLTGAMLSSAKLVGYLATVSCTSLGVFYVALPLSLLGWVCLRPGGRAFVLFALVLVWTGDTAAFFVGRARGRHKLSPLISPGKSWEGAAASLLSALLVGHLFARWFWPGVGALEGATVVSAINVAAQIGDLAESAMKRSAGVKDSSHLLPGHGGVLDRIDGLLFVGPVLWYYWTWKSP